jgi:hypothetical protein
MEWLQAGSLATFIHQTKWAFTTIEVIHVIAISLVIGMLLEASVLGLDGIARFYWVWVRLWKVVI